MSKLIYKNILLKKYHVIFKYLNHDLSELKCHLDKDEYHALEILGDLKQGQVKNVNGAQAQAGKMGLLINTILTGLLGAWLGIAGFVGLSLNSIIILIAILLLTALIGGVVGGFSVRQINKKVNSYLEQKRVGNIKIRMLRFYNFKLYSKLIKEKKQLQDMLNHVQIECRKPKLDSINYNPLKCGINKLIKSLKNLTCYIDYSIFTTLVSLIPSLIKCHPNEKEFNLDEIKAELEDKNCPKKEAKKKSDYTKPWPWINENIVNILINIFPLFCGTFGSMFVFLSGGKSIAKSMELQSLFLFLDHPVSKIIGVIFAVLVTCYFAYANSKNDYYEYKRDVDLKKTQKIIAALQERQARYMDNLLFFTESQLALTEINDFFKQNDLL